MVKLVKPNPNQHKYVVGIDFGHGETSAAICELQWDTKAGQSIIDASDIRINPKNTGNEKVIVSAISRRAGQEKVMIGTDAFAGEQLGPNSSIRVCFKEAPRDLKGEKEQLMILFMKAVYERILDIQPELTEGDNHLVYIARPSGWQDEDVKERYCKMAIKAGIPLAGLTSESRAAIFYALNNPKIGIAKKVEKGVIVFDLGSSTLDFTYLSKDAEPIDWGTDKDNIMCGASVIEKAIYDDKIANNDGVRLLLSHNPQYKDALLFKARQIKEEAYQKDDSHSIDQTFLLGNIVTRDCSDYNEVKRVFVEIEYENVSELTNSIEEKVHYISNLKKALHVFKDEYIPNKPINGVFLTGGASRMSFVEKTIRKEYDLKDEEQVRLDPDNPSLTISRGIAMLGRADCISEVMVKELEAKIKTINVNSVYDSLIDKLSDRIADNSWDIVVKELRKFKNSNIDLCVEELETSIRVAMRHYISVEMPQLIMTEANYAIKAQSEKIREELNKIVEFYNPGTKLKDAPRRDVNVNTSAVNNKLQSMIDSVVEDITEQVTDNISKIVSDVIWAAIGLFLWGLLYVGYKGVKAAWNYFTKTEKERKEEERKEKEKLKTETRKKKLDKSTRQKCYDKIMSGATSNKNSIRTDIKHSFSSNRQLKSSLTPEIKKYATEFVQDNINSVRIPIE